MMIRASNCGETSARTKWLRGVCFPSEDALKFRLLPLLCGAQHLVKAVAQSAFSAVQPVLEALFVANGGR